MLNTVNSTNCNNFIFLSVFVDVDDFVDELFTKIFEGFFSCRSRIYLTRKKNVNKNLFHTFLAKRLWKRIHEIEGIKINHASKSQLKRIASVVQGVEIIQHRCDVYVWGYISKIIHIITLGW